VNGADEPAAGAPPPEVAVDELFAGSYRQLKRLAHARLRDGGRDVVLDTTALVHETYLKLSRSQGGFPDRARFLVYAGRVMRSVIVDLVRARLTDRRGGEVQHVTLTGDVADAHGLPNGEETILQVHQALEQMAAADPRMAQVVEMRYFAGLTDAEIGEALGVTGRTVRRDWEHARLFLAALLR
jgi:RNA polymerase sigma factor (TIGR02999 family)